MAKLIDGGWKMANLSGKVAVITGGTSGIGLATAKNFIANGAKVVIAALQDGNEAAVIESLGGEEKVNFFPLNVANEEEVKNLIAYVVDLYGRVDIAVASAGVSGFTLDVYDSDVWKKTLDINLNGVFYLDKYAVEQMKKQGKGAIVNVGSATSLVGNVGTVCYPASKHGVAGLTKSAAITNIKDGVRINGVVPGFVTTALTAKIPKDDYNRNLAMIPIGRASSADEVACAINFLASDEASYVVGSMLVVDGGYTVQ